MKLYIFRYAHEEGEPVITRLSKYDGKLCGANITEDDDVMSLVKIYFLDDGYETCAYVYELEEVNDGQ